MGLDEAAALQSSLCVLLAPLPGKACSDWLAMFSLLCFCSSFASLSSLFVALALLLV